MPKKYDVYDERGRKIGEAEERPSAAEQVIGAFILFWLIWQILQGIGALILLIIEFLKDHPKLALVLLVSGAIITLYLSVYLPSQEKEAARAREIAIATKQAIYQSQMASALSSFREVMRRRGVIEIHKSFAPYKGDPCWVRVEYLEFASSGIRINLEAECAEWIGDIENSCIIWQGQSGGKPWKAYFRYNTYLPILDGQFAKPISSALSKQNMNPNKVPSAATVYHYKGDLLYPYSIIPDDSRALGYDTGYYFLYGCVDHEYGGYLQLFDIKDF